jgi:hypothetical protein
MNLKYLDKINCRALLPQIHGLSIARLLDDYLRTQINEEIPGLIKSLIKHNEKTSHLRRGSQRLRNSPVEIALIYNLDRNEINMQSIQQPMNYPTNFHIVLNYENKFSWKSIIPLQFLLKGWGDANRGHQCYFHTISKYESQKVSPAEMHSAIYSAEADTSIHYPYVGITGRNWLHRFREHMGEMGRGSRKRFHSAWRDSTGQAHVHFSSHLVDINLTKDEAMSWEEDTVDRAGPNRLNMISGGYKGLRELHEYGLINRPDISLEERDKAIAKYARQNPRKGMPNPFIAELWKDDEYYLKVIEARPKTLSPDQVREIRRLAGQNRTIVQIVEEVGALNETQVKNVIAGNTYTRIK